MNHVAPGMSKCMKSDAEATQTHQKNPLAAQDNWKTSEQLRVLMVYMSERTNHFSSPFFQSILLFFLYDATTTLHAQRCALSSLSPLSPIPLHANKLAVPYREQLLSGSQQGGGGSKETEVTAELDTAGPCSPHGAFVFI